MEKGEKWLLRCKYCIFKCNLHSYLVNTTSQYSEKENDVFDTIFWGKDRLPHLEKPCSLLLRWGKQHFFWFLSPIGIFFVHYIICSWPHYQIDVVIGESKTIYFSATLLCSKENTFLKLDGKYLLLSFWLVYM